MLPFYALNKFKIFLRIPLFNKFLSRVLRRNTRLYMRGYEKAKKKPGLNFFNELYIDLCETNIDCNFNLEEFLNKTNINLKYSLRQSVISKLLNCNEHSLQKVFFKAFEDCKPIAFSLPFEYIIKIEQKGFKVNHFSCLTLWKFLIFLEFFQGVKEAIIYIMRNIFCKLKKAKIKKADAYFLGLSLNKLPIKFQRESNCQCFNYFGAKFYQQKNILLAHNINIKNRKLDHNVKLEFQRYPFGYLSSWLQILELIYFLLLKLIFFPINFFSNNLVSTFLFRELFFAKICSLQKKKFLAKSYLFNNSFFLRPFWTFIAEKKRSEIIFYFFSGNDDQIENKDGSIRPLSFNDRYLNWPNYVFWNKYQEKIYKNFFFEKPSSISFSGPICLHNRELKENFKLPSRSISVFNVHPIRDSIHKSTATSIEYYIPKYCLSFLKDILFICEKNNITFCFKSKVNYRKMTAHPSYTKFIDSISDKSNVLIIPEETSPYDLIQKTDISVAMPFTSTPLISKVLKKPSCYYDSSGFIKKNDSAAQGVEILIGINELDNWVLKKMSL